jgi:cell division protein FtsL
MTPPAAAAAPAVRPRGPLPPGRQRTAPARPRRISGPARPRRPVGPAARPSSQPGGIALGLIAALERVSRHRLLDRLARGRTSIALVAFALIGIVTLQLGLLKLNSSIGRTLARESVLQRENATLGIENSELASGDRIDSRATQLGMTLVPVGAVRFLSVRPRTDAARAAAALQAPPLPASGAERKEGAASGSAAGSSTPSSTTSEAPASSGEQTSTQTTQAPPSAESSSSSTQATPSSSEAGASPSSASSQQAAAPSAGAPEATPAGGTQAGPTE